MFLALCLWQWRFFSFPRASGDVPEHAGADGGFIRFSPRERGCSLHPGRGTAGLDVFPARAGMFPAVSMTEPRPGCFPRASGDVPDNSTSE